MIKDTLPVGRGGLIFSQELSNIVLNCFRKMQCIRFLDDIKKHEEDIVAMLSDVVPTTVGTVCFSLLPLVKQVQTSFYLQDHENGNGRTRNAFVPADVLSEEMVVCIIQNDAGEPRILILCFYWYNPLPGNQM